MQEFSPKMASDSGQAAVIYVPATETSGSNISEKYPHKQSIGFGITQIVIGSLCIVFNLIDLAVFWSFTLGFVGHGIWSGALFIVTGSIGVGAGKTKTNCMIIAYMVLCIIAASLCIVLLLLGSYGAIIIAQDRYSYGYFDFSSSVHFSMQTCLAIMAVIAAVMCIWGSVICCKAGVCGGSSLAVPAFVRANNNPATGQVMYIDQPPESQLGNDNYPPVYSNHPEGAGVQRFDHHSDKDALFQPHF